MGRIAYEIIDDGLKEKIILLRYDDGSEEEKTYAVITMDEIGEQYKNYGKICLDGRYIKNFSAFELNGEESVHITSFSAKDTFFDGDTSFKAVFWDKGVSFKGTNFGDGDLSFEKSDFGKDDVSFERVNFGKGNVDFKKANFGQGNVSFKGAYFGEGKVDFSLANFGEIFMTFSHAVFDHNLLLFSNNTFNGIIDLNIKEADKIIFRNCINNHVVRMNGQSEKINSLAFINMINLGIIKLNWNTYKNVLKQTVDGEPDHRIDQYKMLKQNFNNLGEYDWEDEVYVEYRRLATEKITGHPFKKGFYRFLDRIGGYGTNPMQVFMTMLHVVFLFGVIYFFFPGVIQELPDGLQTIHRFFGVLPEGYINGQLHWWGGFYYSLITFLTIGYGDYSAQNVVIALLAGIEGFCGVFLMSYFSVALVRKILR